jgi:hypothetical protein
MRLRAHPLLLVLLLSAAPTASAQDGQNTVLTGFAGVPWGTPLEAVRSALGPPGSERTYGDTTDLTYAARDFMGLQARMWVRTTPREGLIAGGYMTDDRECGTFVRVRDQIMAAHPRLVPTLRQGTGSAETGRSMGRDSLCAGRDFVGVESFRDPHGPGKLVVTSASTPERERPLNVMYLAAWQQDEWPSGGRSADPEAPADRTLAHVGMTTVPPAGFPLFKPVFSEGGLRGYLSESGTRKIEVVVYDPGSSWGPGDVKVRRAMLAVFDPFLRQHAVGEPVLEKHDDSTHLMSSSRSEIERGGRRGRAVARVYVAREGCHVGVAIRVVDLGGGTDPADDPEIAAFLAGAPPRADDCAGRPPAVFREGGIEMTLIPGFERPMQVRLGERGRTFAAHMGTKSVILVFNEPIRGGERWPLARRLAHLRILAVAPAEVFRGSREEIRARNGLAFSEFRGTGTDPARAVRVRVYATMSGPLQTFQITYGEFDSRQISDEQAVTEMFESVRPTPDGQAAP